MDNIPIESNYNYSPTWAIYSPIAININNNIIKDITDTVKKLEIK